MEGLRVEVGIREVDLQLWPEACDLMIVSDVARFLVHTVQRVGETESYVNREW